MLDSDRGHPYGSTLEITIFFERLRAKMPPREDLLSRIDGHEATIGVMGLGYVGLPLAMACADAGYQVVGIDIDEDRVQTLSAGRSDIRDVPSEVLAKHVVSRQFKPTSRFRDLQECDVILICVPTPLNKTKEPDVSFIVGALREVTHFLRRGQLVVLESTTYPGFTREVALPTLEESGYICGEEYFLAFSPERTDPGNAHFGVTNTTKILGGITATCTDAAARLYEQILEQVHVVSSTDTAEMVKLLENTFRAVNIGLVNEMALMCHYLGIDTWEVIEAASTKPFGFMPFYPGPGLGGHCIPVDPLYLSWKLRSHNYTARFIELAQTVNAAMPEFVVRMVGDALNDHGKPVRGSRVVVFGVAYKPDIDDIRESPALEIIGVLSRKGAIVTYSDPYVPSIQIDGQCYESVNLEQALEGTDVAVITTDHQVIDLRAVVEGAPLVVDTRNATRRVEMSEATARKVYRL